VQQAFERIEVDRLVDHRYVLLDPDHAVVGSGHDHAGDLREVRVVLDHLQELYPVHDLHEHINEHQARALFLEHGQRLAPVPDADRPVALVLYDVLDGLGDVAIVVEDQDASASDRR